MKFYRGRIVLKKDAPRYIEKSLGILAPDGQVAKIDVFMSRCLVSFCASGKMNTSGAYASVFNGKQESVVESHLPQHQALFGMGNHDNSNNTSKTTTVGGMQTMQQNHENGYLTNEASIYLVAPLFNKNEDAMLIVDYVIAVDYVKRGNSVNDHLLATQVKSCCKIADDADLVPTGGLGVLDPSLY